MRRWRGTKWVDPRDLADDWLQGIAELGDSAHAPKEWRDECYNEWGRRGFPRPLGDPLEESEAAAAREP